MSSPEFRATDDPREALRGALASVASQREEARALAERVAAERAAQAEQAAREPAAREEG